VSWFNQVLATFTFFTIAHWLHHRKDHPGILPKWSWIVSFLPAVFMCSVSSCFILIDSDNGFGLSPQLGYWIGLSFTAVVTIMFLVYNSRTSKKE
jgi:carbon starvation protein CstA